MQATGKIICKLVGYRAKDGKTTEEAKSPNAGYNDYGADGAKT